MNVFPSAAKTKHIRKHSRSTVEVSAEVNFNYGNIPEKLPSSSNAFEGQRPSIMLRPLPTLSQTVLKEASQTHRFGVRRSTKKPINSNKKKKRKSKTLKQNNSRPLRTPVPISRILLKPPTKEVKVASATQIATGKQKQTLSREKSKGRLSRKFDADVAPNKREKRFGQVPVKPQVTILSCDVCNDSDRDVESNKPQKKKKNNMLKIATTQPLPTQVASEDNETLTSVDGDMPELALPNYCLPEGEFEDPAPIEKSSKRN